MKVLLIGAHGRTGRHIARQLRAASLPFKVLLRKSAHRGEFAALGAEIVLGDLTNDFSHAFDDVTHVIYAAGSAESEGVNEERAINPHPLHHPPTSPKHPPPKHLLFITP